MPRFQLSLLGGFQACLDDHPLDGFQSNKARGLLIYLAVEADRPHSRAKLAGLLWADLPEKRALTYLRHALANLRKIFADADAVQPFLLVTPQALQFNRQSDYWLDVAELLAALDAPTGNDLTPLETALEGKDRPFLDGFFLDDCPAFEDWMALTRERLQRRVLAVLQSLTDAYTQRDDYQRAIGFARRGLALDPWREEAHRQLIHLLARSGQRSAALAQYESCRRLLAEELDVEPGAETTALYRDILVGEFDRTSAPASPAVSPPTTPHNLPASLTPLVGREETIGAVQQLFNTEQARLVTLTGPGGVGKTRLSLALAWAMLDAFPHGVYFVELAPVQSADFVLSALADAIGLRYAHSDRPLIEQVSDHLHGQTVLLVLDNFEHLLDAGALVAKLLAVAPHLKVLATSRVRLRLRGEFTFVVPPLPVTDDSSPAGALELFRQRARAANQHFVLDATNSAQAAALCTRLDGLPLAIELAAARLKYHALPSLLAGLSGEGAKSSLALLKAEFQDVPERQRSLWATIGWSYDLLSGEEQTLFRRLAVFVGGWTGEAAQAVCGEGIPLMVGEGMWRLVDAHLIFLAHGAVDGPRYGMLETIREFGLAQLQGSDELLLVQRAHASFYNEMAAHAEPQMRTKNSAHTLAYMRKEYPNIRTALRWALIQRDVALCLSLGDVLLTFWQQHSLIEADAYLQEILALTHAAPPSASHVHTLVSAGYALLVLGRQPRGRQHMEHALAMDAAIGYQGDPYKIGMAYRLLAWYQFYAGEYDAAEATWEVSLQHAYSAGDDWNLAMQLLGYSALTAKLGHLTKAAVLSEEGFDIFHRIDDKRGMAVAHAYLGATCFMQGNRERAKTLLQIGWTLCEEIQNGNILAGIQCSLALLSMAEGDHAQAATLLGKALAYRLTEGAIDRAIEVLDSLAQLAAQDAQYEQALRLSSTVVNQFKQMGHLSPPLEKQKQEACIALARQNLNEEKANRAWQMGVDMTLEQAAHYAEEVVRAIAFKEKTE